MSFTATHSPSSVTIEKSLYRKEYYNETYLRHEKKEDGYCRLLRGGDKLYTHALRGSVVGKDKK